MSQGLPTDRTTDPTTDSPTADRPLIPELEGYRTGFRWAKGEIRNLTEALDLKSMEGHQRRHLWQAREAIKRAG
jgi:hypothetical protein